jgi:acylphosphatase
MQLHILVSGRVQGVGFRDFARRSAEKFGVRGYAKNLANGDVEVVAEGDKAALDEFAMLLEHGPPAGRIDHVWIDELKCGGEYTGFDIHF